MCPKVRTGQDLSAFGVVLSLNDQNCGTTDFRRERTVAAKEGGQEELLPWSWKKRPRGGEQLAREKSKVTSSHRTGKRSEAVGKSLRGRGGAAWMSPLGPSSFSSLAREKSAHV